MATGPTQSLGGVQYAFKKPVASALNSTSTYKTSTPSGGMGTINAPTAPLVGPGAGGGGSWGGEVKATEQIIAPPVNPLGAGIASSTKPRADLAADSVKLDAITAPGNDPMADYLVQKDIRREVNYEPGAGGVGTEEKTAAAQGFKRQRQAESDYNDYAAGLRTLGIQSGLTRYAPELQADRMFNAQQAERMKIQDIQDTEELAIAKAKEARLNKDSVKLKEHLAEVKAARVEKRQAIQDQLNKRTQDITVAKSVAPYLLDSLSRLDPKKKAEMILQTAKENNVSPTALVSALTIESDNSRKFDMQMQRQQQIIDKAMGGGAVDNTILTPSVLNTLKKQNGLLDLTYGVTKGEALQLAQTAEKAKTAMSAAYSDPENVDDDGYFTAGFVSGILDGLPEGISREGFLGSIKDKLYLNKYKYAKDYGISQDEFETLTTE